MKIIIFIIIFSIQILANDIQLNEINYSDYYIKKDNKLYIIECDSGNYRIKGLSKNSYSFDEMVSFLFESNIILVKKDSIKFKMEE